jgi:hypothetical protein
LNNSIKFVTDFAANTSITGSGISGWCLGTCYLQLNSNAPQVQVTANGMQYNINTNGSFTQVILNPVFNLLQQPGFQISNVIQINNNSYAQPFTQSMKLFIPLYPSDVVTYFYTQNNGTMISE